MVDKRFSLPYAWLAATLALIGAYWFHTLPASFTAALVLYCGYNALIELYVGMSFLTPGKKKPSYEAEGWTHHDLAYGADSLHAVAFKQAGPAPLLILVHGWRSSSRSVGDRGAWFAQRGWHVLLIELPSHGASTDMKFWTAYKSMQAIKTVCSDLDAIFSKEDVTKASYYGHSIGCFIGLRLVADREFVALDHSMSNIILESPMTMYSPILNEIALKLRIPSFLMSVYRKRLIRRFNASIGQKGLFSSIDEFDLPLWGFPNLPTLCIQADPDNRLGMGHYELLTTAYADSGQSDLLTSHRLPGLTHAGAKVNEERNRLIADWLDVQS